MKKIKKKNHILRDKAGYLFLVFEQIISEQNTTSRRSHKIAEICLTKFFIKVRNI